MLQLRNLQLRLFYLLALSIVQAATLSSQQLFPSLRDKQRPYALCNAALILINNFTAHFHR